MLSLVNTNFQIVSNTNGCAHGTFGHWSLVDAPMLTMSAVHLSGHMLVALKHLLEYNQRHKPLY